MWAIVTIRALIKDLYQIFLNMTFWCWNHDPPFGWFGDQFVDVYFALTDLHYALYEIALWFEDLEERVASVITESTIFKLLQKWLNYAENAWSWVRYAWDNVTAIIDEWWRGILPHVIGYIDRATEGLSGLIEAWDNFWTVTFPYLVSFTWLDIWWDSRLLDVQSLIDTAILNLEGTLAGWQEIRDSVMEFFADPLEWLWARFTDWFFGKEE